MQPRVRTTAVIVTYNRLSLLKRCLSAVIGQTRPPEEILVINNSSTDGTAEWLKDFSSSNPQVKVCNLPRNIGGAGGFEYGIGRAVERGADYVWVMDDDTIPQPDALSELFAACETMPNVGFAASRVNWTDGTMNRMNYPLFRHDKSTKHHLESVTSTTRCDGATFVSLLIPRKVIMAVGLPIGDFFIWHDDIEYTGRITSAGYIGVYVPASIVTHATMTNEGPSVITAPITSKHRFYYQIRNQIATKRLRTNSFAALLSGWFRLQHLKRKIRRRANFKDEFMEEVIRGYRDSKYFRPIIKFPKVSS